MGSENLIWLLAGVGLGLFLAMLGFAAFAALERRALGKRLRAARSSLQADVAPATTGVAARANVPADKPPAVEPRHEEVTLAVSSAPEVPVEEVPGPPEPARDEIVSLMPAAPSTAGDKTSTPVKKPAPVAEVQAASPPAKAHLPPKVVPVPPGNESKPTEVAIDPAPVEVKQVKAAPTSVLAPATAPATIVAVTALPATSVVASLGPVAEPAPTAPAAATGGDALPESGRPKRKMTAMEEAVAAAAERRRAAKREAEAAQRRREAAAELARQEEEARLAVAQQEEAARLEVVRREKERQAREALLAAEEARVAEEQRLEAVRLALAMRIEAGEVAAPDEAAGAWPDDADDDEGQAAAATSTRVQAGWPASDWSEDERRASGGTSVSVEELFERAFVATTPVSPDRRRSRSDGD